MTFPVRITGSAVGWFFGVSNVDQMWYIILFLFILLCTTIFLIEYKNRELFKLRTKLEIAGLRLEKYKKEIRDLKWQK
jgi:low affinity Fe/Cu permease